MVRCLPLIATVTFNTEPMQYVVAALLRPGMGGGERPRSRPSRPRAGGGTDLIAGVRVDSER